jgi:carboxypeptidase Taq
MALIEREIHRKMTGPELGELAQNAIYAAGEDALLKEAGKYWLETHEDMRKVPEALMSELAEVASKGTSVWHDATTFEEVQPFLERLVHLNRSYAACYPEYKPYDCLLDGFDPGMTQEFLDTKIVPAIKPELLRIREQVNPGPRASFLTKSHLQATKPTLLAFCKNVTQWMGYDYNRGVIAETEHPFMASVHRDDVRIAASLRPKDPLWTIKAVVHEAGHALYEQNAEHTRFFTLDSTSIHESQSLFWECMVGQSDLFWNRWFDDFSSMTCYRYTHPNDLLADFRHNDQSNLIRLQSGNLDYGLHILIRYELERDLFENGLEVKDMKGRFNELCKSYLGREPKEDRREGVLQDTHWPSGLFGYFPCYIIGAAFAAQLWESSPKDSPENIRTYLQDRVYQHGGRYSFADLSDMNGGFDAKPYIRNLESAYLTTG